MKNLRTEFQILNMYYTALRNNVGIDIQKLLDIYRYLNQCKRMEGLSGDERELTMWTEAWWVVRNKDLGSRALSPNPDHHLKQHRLGITAYDRDMLKINQILNDFEDEDDDDFLQRWKNL